MKNTAPPGLVCVLGLAGGENRENVDVTHMEVVGSRTKARLTTNATNL